ncbi:hypothetical protein COLO4_27974 [Corchorus olitorius]|uniref:F-box domain-containing protein n=1 Tax=Corchorus olitorius TaxID=93759 RepID=A0A1R3HN70_9ROSI|nr:hypothetical protein COLO4_27974 [Corchorus olitorius]
MASGSPDLPSYLLMEIFLRLPIMALGKCRCVCKTWFRIISNPEFAKLHHSVSPTCILIKDNPPNRESKRLFLSQVFEDSETNRFQFDRMNFTTRFDLPNIGSFSLVNSCNGLVCLSGVAEKLIYVCNPVLGTLDQGAGCLVIFDDPKTDAIYPANIGKVVDSLYVKYVKIMAY